MSYTTTFADITAPTHNEIITPLAPAAYTSEVIVDAIIDATVRKTTGRVSIH